MLVSIDCTSSNLNQKLSFATTAWTHPRISFIGLLLSPALAFYSIYPTFSATIYPTLIFFLPRFASFLSKGVVPTGELVVVLGVGVWETPEWRALGDINIDRVFFWFRFLFEFYLQRKISQH